MKLKYLKETIGVGESIVALSRALFGFEQQGVSVDFSSEIHAEVSDGVFYLTFTAKANHSGVHILHMADYAWDDFLGNVKSYFPDADLSNLEFVLNITAKTGTFYFVTNFEPKTPVQINLDLLDSGGDMAVVECCGENSQFPGNVKINITHTHTHPVKMVVNCKSVAGLDFGDNFDADVTVDYLYDGDFKSFTDKISVTGFFAKSDGGSWRNVDWWSFSPSFTHLFLMDFDSSMVGSMLAGLLADKSPLSIGFHDVNIEQSVGGSSISFGEFCKNICDGIDNKKIGEFYFVSTDHQKMFEAVKEILTEEPWQDASAITEFLDDNFSDNF